MYKLNFSFLDKYAGALLKGFGNTIIIIIGSFLIGFFLGMVMALLRRSKHKAVEKTVTIVVDFLRNTPFLVQLFFLFYGLPQLGVNTDPIVTATIALGINTSATNCEVIRSGLMAVKRGYYECSMALGFTPLETLRYVVLPISLRVAFKPLTSNFINLILTSSVAFSVTVMEIMGVAKTMAARTARPFEVYLLIMASYCILTFFVAFVAKLIDRKISIVL